MVSKEKEYSSTHFAHRFKTARKMAGLSMEDLVSKTGRVVTRQSVSKYEKGVMRPSPEVLRKLAEAMNVQTGFFSRGRKMNLARLQFRQKSKLSRKEEESLKFKTIDYLGCSHELEARLGRKISFINPAGRKTVSSISDVEAATKEIRQAWHMGQAPVVNLLGLLEEKGIKVYLTDSEEEFDGLTARNQDCHVIILNKDRPLDRLRFTAAHELAHIMFDLTHHVGHEERLCHSFAGSFLIPGEALRDFIGSKRKKISLWEWKHVKEIYGISMQAAIHRAYELQVISSHYFNDLLRMLKRNGWDRTEPFGYKGKEEASRFKKILAYALAEKIITPEEAKRFGSRFLEESELQKIMSAKEL
ncbi:MAG: XRE family transcriptional regulator [Candidatus Aminicenantes bacterium]